MLATRNFSSKYDAHGKYFTGPSASLRQLRTIHVSQLDFPHPFAIINQNLIIDENYLASL